MSFINLFLAQRVHVGIIWYILRAQRVSHIPTLRAKYIPYNYMDPLGWAVRVTDSRNVLRKRGDWEPDAPRRRCPELILWKSQLYQKGHPKP